MENIGKLVKKVHSKIEALAEKYYNKGYIDLTLIKVPVNHNGEVRFVNARRG